jgi:ABC-type amino acid transport substrate-binding protein
VLYVRLTFAALFLFWAQLLSAQVLTVQTVTRPPFSMVEEGRDTGFSIELLRLLSERLGWEYQIERSESFADMLQSVRERQADLAVANISITAAREVEMDFSHPIFESGLQIMVQADEIRQPSLLRALFSWDLAAAIGIAFLLLFTGGMFMWMFERRAQPYFDRPLKEAWFPSFWWALNLVVNGGFEERVPRTPVGRMFGVVLVVSSLFIVSVFVAKITAVMTVEAISGSVNSVNDLYGKPVGTIEGSTAAGFLDRREIDYAAYPGLDAMLEGFEEGEVKAVVFDAPVLNYYAQKGGHRYGHTIGQPFLRENYGLVFPSGSPLVEDVNQALLAVQEDGSYDALYREWFGSRD